MGKATSAQQFLQWAFQFEALLPFHGTLFLRCGVVRGCVFVLFNCVFFPLCWVNLLRIIHVFRNSQYTTAP